jgi:hypothetical protein
MERSKRKPGSAKHDNKFREWAIHGLILALRMEVSWPFSDVVKPIFREAGCETASLNTQP